MEDGRGNAHFVRVPALKKLLQAGNLASLRFVFVSACFSEAAAQAFVDAGVPHVVAVRLNTRVSDHAAHAFTRAFYLALAVGNTIKESFDIGVQAVVNAPNVPAAEVEASSSCLAPAARCHPLPVARFGRAVAAARTAGCEASSSCPQGGGLLGPERRDLPHRDRLRPPSRLSHRPAGVGKSAVSIAAINYLAERHYFSDGVVYVDCSNASDMTVLGSFLREQLAVADSSGGPSTAEPPSSEPPQAASSSGGGLVSSLRSAIAPLQGLHCLLVLDGVRSELTRSEVFPEFLSLLLSFARVRTLLTAVSAVGQPLQGGAEKVVDIQPLSKLNTARLLCRLSPRPLLLSEIQGAGSAADFVQRLAQHDLIETFNGNPGLVKATAPRLSKLKLAELHAEQIASAQNQLMRSWIDDESEAPTPPNLKNKTPPATRGLDLD